MNISGATPESPSLTVGIPAGRTVDWTQRIFAGLDHHTSYVEALIGRWAEDPFTEQEIEDLNGLHTARQILSDERHGAALRNAIVREASSTHILFLDDDMVPGQELIANALDIAARAPNVVHQGIPYRVANPQSWLARTEGKLYERGYEKYVGSDDTVDLLDARLLLAPTETLRETPFEESLVFGSGDGSELARDLIQKGVVLRLARELDAAHTNRDTVASLAKQKFVHGKGRGYELANYGPGEDGWLAYCKYYAKRHYLEPVLRRGRGDIDTGELAYIWGTNTVMWAGVLEYMLKADKTPT